MRLVLLAKQLGNRIQTQVAVRQTHQAFTGRLQSNNDWFRAVIQLQGGTATVAFGRLIKVCEQTERQLIQSSEMRFRQSARAEMLVKEADATHRTPWRVSVGESDVATNTEHVVASQSGLWIVLFADGLGASRAR